MTARPVRFVLGIHVHQPVGNFDRVFAQHVEDVYLPFLRALADRDAFPIALHVSGPLVEWLRDHDRRYLDLVGRLVADGKVELLLAGCYEPILAAVPRVDRVEQIEWLRALLSETLGRPGSTLWLTERVWEPDLPADLAAAGVEAVLLDDRHFLVNGLAEHQLHAPYHTESDGHGLWVLPIDERLRYLVPFRPPAETAAHIYRLREGEQYLAVLVDDGEKFGGWPGTKEWVYERGWLKAFLDMLDRLRGEGALTLTTPTEAIRDVPSAGLAYLPTASYREMEAWALWPDAARRLQALEAELGEERLEGAEGPLVRGTHWRNFLARYPESNRMHKKMLRLSQMTRAAGDPAAARRAIARAQCNDAYWHGIFGGLYLPHLRAAIWRELAAAEGMLRSREGLAWEVLDLDEDGHPELWIHSDSFSAIVSPARGGGIEEYSVFAAGINHADVLTRRREAYHEVTAPPSLDDARGGTPSIHDLERRLALDTLPPIDAEGRAILQERVYDEGTEVRALQAGTAEPLETWACAECSWETTLTGGVLRVVLRPRRQPGGFEKTLEFERRGLARASFRWRAPRGSTARFATEISHRGQLTAIGSGEPMVWTYPIETVAKSERGLDRTSQGTALVFVWPASLGSASVTFPFGEAL